MIKHLRVWARSIGVCVGGGGSVLPHLPLCVCVCVCVCVCFAIRIQELLYLLFRAEAIILSQSWMMLIEEDHA